MMFVAIAVRIGNKEVVIVILILRHTADDSTECCQLVSVSDGKLGFGSIVPGIVELALPLCCLGNKVNLGEGCHSEDYVTGHGIVVELVVSIQVCGAAYSVHRNGNTVLQVVEGVVTDVQTGLHSLLNGDEHRHGIILGNTCHVNVERAESLTVAQSQICVTLILFGNGESQLIHAVLNGNTCGNYCGNALTFNGCLGGNLVVLGGNVNGDSADIQLG